MTGSFSIFGSSAKADALKRELAARGWTESDGGIDLLVLVPDAAPYASPDGIDGFSDWESLGRAYEGVTGGFLRDFSRGFQRLRENGRIALVTEARSSISTCCDKTDFGSHMALASVNMAMMALFNELYPKGYTFRAFAGENMRFCAEYIERDRSLDGATSKHSDESRLTLRTDHGVDLPW